MTYSSLTFLEVSLMLSLGFFCLLVCSYSLFSVICYEAFCLYVATNFFCIPIFCPKQGLYLVLSQSLCLCYTRAVWKVKNICAYNPRSCFIVPDQSFGVFSRGQIVTWCSWCSELFHIVSVTGCDNERADIKSHRL